MRRHSLHSTYRIAHTAAILLAVAFATGCAVWKDRLNPANYRDSRAVEIEQRLDKTTPVIADPF